MRARSPIDVVEAAYRLEGDESAWLGAIVDAIFPDVSDGRGVYAFTAKVAPEGLTPGASFVQRDLDPALVPAIARYNAEASSDATTFLANNLVIFGGLREVLGAEHADVRAFDDVFRPLGVRDGLSLFAQDAEGHGVDITAMRGDTIVPSARVRAVWERVGVHVATAFRLRRRMTRGLAVDALFAPSGKLVHAERAIADDKSAIGALSSAAVRVERARTEKQRADPERALELWQGLVAGEWSMVDRWESDGRRYVAAVKNRPGVLDPRALTPLERTVAEHVRLAAPNKVIAFAVGLPENTIKTVVRRVFRKLGCKRRSDLGVLLGARAEVADVDVGEGGPTVRVVATAPDSAAGWNKLSPTESAVARALLSGETNRAIAARRGVSPATVAKQVQAVFDKLGVRSRAELARALA